MTIYSCTSTEQPSCQLNSCKIIINVLSVSIDTVVPACENPNSINRWCRWVLSGLNGDVPCMMRANITRSVSNTGIDNTASVNGISPKLLSVNFPTIEPLASVLITNDENTTPRTRVPPSPINILDVLPNTLWKKNGISEPAVTTANVSIEISPARAKSIAKAMLAITQ